MLNLNMFYINLLFTTYSIYLCDIVKYSNFKQNIIANMYLIILNIFIYKI